MLVDVRTDEGVIPDLIADVERTRSARHLEFAAEAIGAAHDHRAIPALLRRLGDPVVEKNDYLQVALCEALVELGVMQRFGTQRYGLLPRHALAADAVALLSELYSRVPLRYFVCRR